MAGGIRGRGRKEKIKSMDQPSTFEDTNADGGRNIWTSLITLRSESTVRGEKRKALRTAVEKVKNTRKRGLITWEAQQGKTLDSQEGELFLRRVLKTFTAGEKRGIRLLRTIPVSD